jgi:hypothetical protein
MISRNPDGDVAFTIDERDELVSALKELLRSTEIGQLYTKEYFTKARADEDGDKIIAAAVQIAGGQLISSRHLEHALDLLITSGELKAKNLTQAVQLEEPEEDKRPRDKNGKLLTQAQLDWSEMTTFAQTATPDAIRQRKHVDGKFREFIQTNLRREMQEQPVGDAVVPAGQSVTKAKASQQLVDFAQKFLREPSSNLRPKNGMVTLAGEQITWPTFNDLLNKATAARLL